MRPWESRDTTWSALSIKLDDIFLDRVEFQVDFLMFKTIKDLNSK